jgi:hypothetical protein
VLGARTRALLSWPVAVGRELAIFTARAHLLGSPQQHSVRLVRASLVLGFPAAFKERLKIGLAEIGNLDGEHGPQKIAARIERGNKNQ